VSWQKSARVGLAIAGLGVAAAIVYYSRKSPPPQEPGSIVKLDPAVASRGAGGNQSVAKDGKPHQDFTYETREEYTDGRMKLTKAVVAGRGENKSKIRADVLETSAAEAGVMPRQLKFTGHVSLEEQGGLTIQTEAASYDDDTGVVTIPGPLTFQRGRTSGEGVGATYDRNKGIVVIQDQSRARVGPDAKGTGSAEAASKRMIMERGLHSVRLEEGARIVSQSQTLTGANAAMHFTEDDTALKFLELRGAARVDPTPGSPANQPAMSADEISMGFHPDGQTLQHARLTGKADLTLRDANLSRSIKASMIDLFTGTDGRTLVSLDAADRVIVTLPASATAPARTITSQTLKATGDEKKGLTSARFEGNPRFEESGGKAAGGAARGGSVPATGTRTGTSMVLILTLGGQLEAIEKADFEQKVHFEKRVDSGRLTADSDLATYREAEGTLKLRPNSREPRRRSSVNSEDFYVESTDIDLSLDTENLIAVGDVKTTLERKAASGAKSSQGGLFAGSDPIKGAAAKLDYQKETGRATYTGAPKARALLQQGDTRIFANELVFEEAANVLRGTGDVDSRIPMTVTDEQGRSQVKEQQVRAETMQYDDASRRAEYHGKPVILTSADGVTEGLTMIFELAEDGKTLKRLRALGNMFASRSDGHEFTGAELDYRMEDDVYILTGASGSPAVMKQPPRDPKAAKLLCDFTEGQKFEFSRRTGDFRSYGPSFSTVPRACTDSLRKPR
jgi:lipopolysaccharide export system protein LptA